MTDAQSSITLGVTPPVNVFPPIRYLAGNTEVGFGGSATAAVFTVDRFNSTLPDVESFVVTSDGTVYFRDLNAGIIKIDPVDGVARTWIAKTGTTSGDGGAASSATLRDSIKIALDYSDNLLIYDYNRIRRVDKSTGIINTIIGGGGSTLDDVAPLSVSFSYVGAPNTAALSPRTAMPFFATPNGRIYFMTEGYSSTLWSAGRVRYYDPVSNTVKSL